MTVAGPGGGTRGNGRKVLVLGGAGFVGRHAVAALCDLGLEVVVGTRHPGRVARRLPRSALDCERRQTSFATLTGALGWHPLVQGVDVVLNCVGILRPRGAATYQRVHHLAPAALAQACRERRIRLIHVSALGLWPGARSGFLTSKLAGEGAIKRAAGDWIIVRPSLLDGPGGYGAWWLRAVARLPFFVVPADARGRIAALHVSDLGEALARLCIGSTAELGLQECREFEIGGTRELSFRSYIAALRRTYTDRPALCIPVPGLAARGVAHVCDVLHATPFSFGHWELLRRDNVPRVNRLPELLGRRPKNVGIEADEIVG